MTAIDPKQLLEQARARPEEAQQELVAIAEQIENELPSRDYWASQEELLIMDQDMASIDAGARASNAEVEMAFARFHRT
jgi:hypothetical protein